MPTGRREWTWPITQFVPGAKCGDKKVRVRVSALLLGDGCLLCCYGTGSGGWGGGGGDSFFQLQNRTVSLVVSWSEQVLLQTRALNGGSTSNEGLLSSLLECCWGGTIFTKCESRPVEGRDSSATSTSRMPSVQFDISQLRSPSEAKWGTWSVWS